MPHPKEVGENGCKCLLTVDSSTLSGKESTVSKQLNLMGLVHKLGNWLT